MGHAVDLEHLAQRWFGRRLAELEPHEREAIASALSRKPVSRDLNRSLDREARFGERLADRVAAFGGSWTFILAFLAFLLVWAGLNLWLGRGAFDPYPFIFLNLMLSMIAAIQAPVIMMSQNRQATRDRLDAANDYRVNLKAEIEIMALHEKMDELRDRQLAELIARQQEQIDLLTRLLHDRKA